MTGQAPRADVPEGSSEGNNSGFRVKRSEGFAIWVREQQIALGPGRTTIGRAASCNIVLSSGLVSRQHAAIVVSEERCTIEDLGSRNGVAVNAKRLTGVVELTAGDSILIGGETLEFRRAVFDSPAGGPTLQQAPAVVVDHDDDPTEHTRAADALELLRVVVDKAIALNRPEQAERVVSGHLAIALDQAQAGVRLPARTSELAARFALRLAEAANKARWIDYTFKLYSAQGVPMPVPLIEELYRVVSRVRGTDVTLLRAYVASLRARSQSLTPNERFGLQRLEGLARIALAG